MGQEIERKFLVKGDFKPFVVSRTKIMQGYLSSVPERTVRIRVRDEKGYITIKGIGNDTGASRFEWEKEIPVSEAKELIKLCEPGIIDKTRNLVRDGKYTFEVDAFAGENQGLVVAEIELDKENAVFEKPEWLGDEVTGDVRYYNAMLKMHPYTQW